MRIFVNKDIKNLFLALSAIWAIFLLLAEVCVYLLCQSFSLLMLFFALLTAGTLWTA